jgi:hypothetical protein
VAASLRLSVCARDRRTDLGRGVSQQATEVPVSAEQVPGGLRELKGASYELSGNIRANARVLPIQRGVRRYRAGNPRVMAPAAIKRLHWLRVYCRNPTLSISPGSVLPAGSRAGSE